MADSRRLTHLVATQVSPSSARQSFWRALLFSSVAHIGMIWLASATIGARFSTSWDDQPGRHLPLTVALRTMETLEEQTTLPLPTPSPPQLQATPSASITIAEPGATTPSNTEQSKTEGDYLPANRLSQLAEPLEIDTLDRADLAKPDESGRLILEILVNAQGGADGVRVIESTVPAAYLANAIRAFQRGTYKPGLELNRPVKSILKVEITLTNGSRRAPSTALPLRSSINQSTLTVQAHRGAFQAQHGLLT